MCVPSCIVCVLVIHSGREDAMHWQELHGIIKLYRNAIVH